MIENVVSRTFSGGLKNYGLKEGGVEYVVDENNKDLLSEDILKKVEDLKAKIIAGEIDVPKLRSQIKSEDKKRK
jgi:basic membrane protein A